MKRRYLLGVATVIVVAPSASAQAPHRIGFLSAQFPGLQQSRVEAMLVEQGYVDGGNAVFIRRFAEARRELLPGLAEELLQERVAVIMTMSTSASLAASRATSAVPIVIVSTGDAIALGLGESLEKPGANVTDNSFLGQRLAVEQLGVLKELVPGLARVAFLGNGLLLAERLYGDTLRAAGSRAGLDVWFADTRRPADFEKSFAASVKAGAQAMIVASGGNYFDQRNRLVELAAVNRVPTLYFRREYVDAGGLISFAPSWRELYGNAARYVHRILNGARPAELPMLQPSRFDLVLNATTARALDLAVPASVLERASEVIW